MFDAIIRFSIQNKVVVAVLTIILIVWGGYALSILPIDAVPDITNNQVQVITVAPSLAAQEIERLVTIPVEMIMATIPGIEEIRSFSRFGLSLITIVFHDNVDVYWARQQVSERLVQAQHQIPSGSGIPEIAPMTTGLGEIYQYILRVQPGYENRYSLMDLRNIQDWIIRRQLLGTQGVADVSSFGGHVRQYEVAINPEKLKSFGITIAEIFTALQKNNQNTGGAYIDKRPEAYFIRSEGLIGSIEDINNIVVRHDQSGIPICIHHLAKVGIGHAARYGAMTITAPGNSGKIFNQETVGAIVLMLKGENSSKVIRVVKEKISAIQKTLPEGITIEPFLDRTKLVNKAISTVVTNLAEGALIVIFVLVLMLGNLRAGLIVASVIPLSMLFAVGMMTLTGVSGNLMSLGAIDFGLIVDGAVIIVEATLHHLSHLQPHKRLTQQETNHEVFVSASLIRRSAMFGELIILIVYLPILSLTGIEGKMFAPMAQTVAFAIAGAFILSLTYVPMMSALLLGNHRSSARQTLSDRLMLWIQNHYSPLLTKALLMPWRLIAASLLMFVVSITLLLYLGGEFLPNLDEGDFAVETRVLLGSSIEHTVEKAKQASELLLKNFPEVEQVVGKIGSAEIATDPMPPEACDLMIILKDRSEWTSAHDRNELAEKMNECISKIPGVTFGFQQPIQMRFNELMTGARQDVVVKLYGEDLHILSEQASKIARLIRSTQGAEDIFVEKITGLEQIIIQYRRSDIARFGVSIEDVNTIVRSAFAGEQAGFVYENERRYDLVVRLDTLHRRNIEDVRTLLIPTPEGEQIPLHQVGNVQFQVAPNQIQHDDAKRRIIIGFNVRDRDVESIVNELKEKVQQHIHLPAGYSLKYGGSFQNLEQAKNRLAIAVPVALLLILLLLYLTFQSLQQSLLVFTAIPLAAIGGIVALWLRQMPFSISAGVGFIALFGVSVLNGIVLISAFNRLRNTPHYSLQEIVQRGTQQRLRPVIMTALVASLGFFPMALSSSAGAEVQKPLATVVIGGLVSATLLTLFILPVCYVLLERRSQTKQLSSTSETEPSL